MNEGLLNLFICLLLGWSIVGCFYRRVLLVLLYRLECQKLEKIKHKMVKLAADRKEDKESFAFRFLSNGIDCIKTSMPEISISGFLHYRVTNTNYEKSESLKRFEKEKSAELERLHVEITFIALEITFVNSPLWFAICAVCVLALQLFHFASKQWIKIQTWLFIENCVATRQTERRLSLRGSTGIAAV